MFAITSAGGVIRTRASEVRQSGRETMGVRLMNLAPGDSVVALARNAESEPKLMRWRTLRRRRSRVTKLWMRQ